jgi:hypothetical protein
MPALSPAVRNAIGSQNPGRGGSLEQSANQRIWVRAQCLHAITRSGGDRFAEPDCLLYP